jgi:uncharacterized OsmC-like protein
MFSLKGLLTRDIFPKFFYQMPRFNFARDVGDVKHLKQFKAGAHKNQDNEIRAFYGEDISISISQPLETLLSCLSTCELKSIMYWAKDNNLKIESLEISTDASYDSRNYAKNTEGKDISKKIDDQKLSEGQYRNKKNLYDEVNVEVSIKTDEKDKNKVLEVLRKGAETCPVHNTLSQAGIKINTKYNIL